MTIFLVVLILAGSSDPLVRGPFYTEDTAKTFTASELLRRGPGRAYVLEESPCPARKRFDIISRLDRNKKET